MKLEFSSVEEVKDFVAQLKGTRGKKGETDDADVKAPAPIAPPADVKAPAFANPSPAFAPPEVTALVQRINAKIDQGVASGQSLESALGWFRQQCGPEAANASLDQIRTVFLFRLPAPALNDIVKLMGA